VPNIAAKIAANSVEGLLDRREKDEVMVMAYVVYAMMEGVKQISVITGHRTTSGPTG